MPKGAKKGKNGRRGRGARGEEFKRELWVKEEGQEYARALKMLGNGRLTGYCFDGKERLCHIRGKLLRRMWIKEGDIILVSLREYQDKKADVIHKYSPEEVRKLRNGKHLPDIAPNGSKDDKELEDCGFTFSEI